MDEMPWFFKIFNQEMLKKEERMREILFRGKTEKGEWVEGSLVTGLFQTNSGEEIVHILNVDGVDYSCFEDLSDYGGGYYEVLPETVGEYTGIRDKNGKRIFEGDIIIIDNDYFVVASEMKWHEGAFLRSFRSNYDAEILLTIPKNKEVEIIGNIYENYELLEKYSCKAKRKAIDERTNETIQPSQG